MYVLVKGAPCHLHYSRECLGHHRKGAPGKEEIVTKC